jgi:hypothetical protein
MKRMMIIGVAAGAAIMAKKADAIAIPLKQPDFDLKYSLSLISCVLAGAVSSGISAPGRTVLLPLMFPPVESWMVSCVLAILLAA